MNEITVDRGKKIFIFDDIFDLSWREHAYQYIKSSFFSIGWADQSDIHNSQHLYLHSRYSEKNVESFGIFKNIKNKDALKLIEGKKFDEINCGTVNLSVPSDTNFVHTHTNTTVLYYANLYWQEDWAGETLFFNEKKDEVVYTSIYKPGRLIIFDGSIPHTIRPQSQLAPHYRFTFASFLDTGVSLTESLLLRRF